MRKTAIAALASVQIALAFSANAVEEGWGVKQEVAPEVVGQSQNPQEPEAVDDEPLVQDTEVPASAESAQQPAETPAPATTPEEAAASTPAPAGVDQNAEEGEVEGEEQPKWIAAKNVKLQGLNKITARTSEIKTETGKEVKFGNLEIKVEKCLRGPEDEKAENTALITIWDEIPGQEKKQVFRGWMFSSSPALSALEHPIYDVILLSCSNGEAPKAAEPKKDEDKGKDEKSKDSKPKDSKDSKPAKDNKNSGAKEKKN